MIDIKCEYKQMSGFMLRVPEVAHVASSSETITGTGILLMKYPEYSL